MRSVGWPIRKKQVGETVPRTNLIHTISHRIAQFLERQGILERNEENSYMQWDGIYEGSMQHQWILDQLAVRLRVRGRYPNDADFS